VVPVQRDHRGATCRRLAHEPGSDELLDHRAGIAGRDTGGSGELPARDGLFETCERLQERAANGWRYVEHRGSKIHLTSVAVVI
jgi:hypothetical protein